MPERAAESQPSIARLRSACQPAEVMSRRNAEHWAGRVYMRKLSIYATWVAVRARASANAVTFAMVLIGLVGAAVFSREGLGFAVAGALLIQLYLLLDCSDGEIARWNATTSATGIYLDRIGHYVVETALLVALGLRAGGWDDPGWAIVGLVAALLHAIGKAETDVVEVARAKHGLPPLRDDGGATAPRARGLAAARRLAGSLPVYRLTGAVEASFVMLAAAIADAAGETQQFTRGLALGMLGVAAFVVVGHLTMILASSRLR